MTIAPNGLATALTVAAWPGTAPRLLRLTEDREDLAEYLNAGGYQPLENPDELLDAVERSGVLGRGGAAQPGDDEDHAEPGQGAEDPGGRGAHAACQGPGR